MIEIVCPVRECLQPLRREERTWECPAGHSFDVARSGYCNLLQPNDRRSKTPGDTKAAVQARRRLLQRGLGDSFLGEIVELLRDERSEGPILDAGCGEGFYLSGICDRLHTNGVGIDISTPAIDLAARTHSEETWIVANIDRRIPIADASLGTILAITSRVNVKEFQRILKPGGILLVALPGADDLFELREAVMGRGVSLDRMPDINESTVRQFELTDRRESRHSIKVERETIDDLLVTTYRGQRRSQSGALSSLESMPITQSRLLVLYRRLAASS